ncbi:hypothetical protein [Salipiger mucosus]|uniref:Uncharacterized protein n=1 Tax=Salipiger mucosus DSM 16094 TaxID=1123237 RepID=S9QPV0_9RHOB|nr:hypothetical protein [Salipiger mucosus]EPX83466.1 hypothetical protein Salmuc_02074 [Salipiger mucosus DSM 16094]
MPKKMTPAEKLVGRKVPKQPKYIDQVMARFVRNRDAEGADRFGARATPDESWLRRAHRQARKNGWIRVGLKVKIGTCRQSNLWFLTETGQAALTLTRNERNIAF